MGGGYLEMLLLLKTNLWDIKVTEAIQSMKVQSRN